MRLEKGSKEALEYMKNLRKMKKNIKGSGFMDYAKQASNILIGKNTINKMDALIHGRNNYPPKVRDILSKYGNEIIMSAIIIRTPIQSATINALNAISLGSFKKKLDRSEYDKLFHLQLVVTISSGLNISIEKNEVINMSVNPKIPQNSESSKINSIPQGLTIQMLMDNTNAYMKHSMFSYSAKDNNCQDFVMGILNGNHIGDESNRIFTKQDIDQLFDNSNYLRKVSNTVTNLGATANVITNGVGLKKIKRYRIIK